MATQLGEAAKWKTTAEGEFAARAAMLAAPAAWSAPLVAKLDVLVSACRRVDQTATANNDDIHDGGQVGGNNGGGGGGGGGHERDPPPQTPSQLRAQLSSYQRQV